MIRRTTNEDIGELIDLVKSVYVNPPYKKYVDGQAWKDYVARNISLVNDDGGKVIAHGGLEINGDYGILSRSFVSLDRRDEGIYGELVQRRIDIAQERGLKYLETHAVAYTDVVQKTLIERFGFVPVDLHMSGCADVMGTGNSGSLVTLMKPLVRFKKSDSADYSDLKLHPKVVEMIGN